MRASQTILETFLVGSEPNFTDSSAREVRGLLGTSTLTGQVSRHALLGSRLPLGPGAWAAQEELTLECRVHGAGLEQAHSSHKHL